MLYRIKLKAQDLMKIKIQTKIDCKTVIKLMLLFVCIERFLEWIGFPHFIIFSLDIANCYLFINLLYNISFNHYTFKSVGNPIIISQVVIIIVGAGISLISGVQPILIFWAIRNFCRFLIFYFACIVYLQDNDIKGIFDLFKIIFFINFIIILIQYKAGYKGDYLGGLFGVEKGANAYCNVFFIIICSYEIASWLYKKENGINLIGILMMSVFISALAELKIFFVELATILIFIFLIYCYLKRNFKLILRVLVIMILSGALLYIGIIFMSKLYPKFADFFTIEEFLYNNTRSTGYSGSGDLNRLTAIMTINKDVFSNMNVIKLFGMGLGSTEYSSWNLLKSDFYNKYSYLHYYWFSDAWMYLENGYLGLILYPAGFVINGLIGIKQIKRYKNINLNMSVMITGITVSFITLALYLYNQSLRLECAYIIYFCLAAMEVEVSERRKENDI